MVRKIINAVIVLPLAIILIVFAVANRHWVTVSLDPFNTSDPAVGIALPLFVVIILSAIGGVLVGGAATWLKQGRWRRVARQNQADAAAARAELAATRSTPGTAGMRPNALLRPPS
jgi:uncharacterized integral membrane protein